ncbi:hypothetical protein RUM44_004344 [Polyplax serrata]|uniref:Spaetzle domain-containing protein n=1 Tax=Polyplax serrata TaxID=468196 RepID=A0ABR1B2K4_POLSC
MIEYEKKSTVIKLKKETGQFTVLTSLPTDPYIPAWQTQLSTYRIDQKSFDSGSIRRNDEGTNGGGILPVLHHKNVTQSKGETNLPRGQPYVYNPHYGDRWYNVNERHPQHHYHHSILPVLHQPEFRQTDQSGNNKNHETSHSVADDNDGVTTTEAYQNFNGTYSSHVNYGEEDDEGGAAAGEEEGEDDKNEARRNKNARGEEEEKPSLGRANGGMEKINFEESSRNYRRGNTRKDGMNVISTTEKLIRNPTYKGGGGNKRQRPSGSKPQSGQIVFPDGYRRQKFTPRGTKCGKKTTFCEHVGEEYPSDYINQILKKEGAMFKEFFGKDVISDPNITERIHAPEENSLCPFRQEVVFPRAAKNKEDKWLFVVNQDQYVQGVTVEVCLNPESRCILTESFPLSYTPYCKQKYIERRLVAIGEDGKPHSDSFRLPSCCSCVLKHETSARMGTLRTSPAERRKRETNSHN